MCQSGEQICISKSIKKTKNQQRKVNSLELANDMLTLKKQLSQDNELIKFLVCNHKISKTKFEQDIMIEVDRFIRTEIILYVVDLIQSDLPLNEANSLFILKNEPLISFEKSKDKKLAQKLRRILMLRYPITNDPLIWYERVQQYMEFPKQLRLFREEKTPKLALVYDIDQCTRATDRLTIYRDFLEEHITKKDLPLKMMKSDNGKYLYVQPKLNQQNNQKQTIPISLSSTAIKIIEEGIDLKPYQLPNYTSKISLSIPENFSIKRMLSYVEGDNSNLPLLKFNFENNQTKHLDLKGVIHILGALGVGKSNFKYGMTRYFLEEQNANRIAIIEHTVTNVFDVVKKLRNMGINAIPIIGKDDEKHLHSVINKMSIEDYLKDEFDFLEWVSGECLILSSQCDFQSETKEAPCNHLKSSYVGDSSSVCCPFITKCGRMKRYRDMNKATVWVTTVHSVISGNIPQAFNPNKRTFFEILYDNTDLIFFDEVDGAQDILDGTFIQSSNLLNGYELSRDLTQLRTRIEKTARFKETPRLSIALVGFENARVHFNELLFNCGEVRQKIKGSTLTIKSLMYQIVKAIDKEKTEIKNIKKLVMELKVLTSVSNIHFYTPNREKEFQTNLEQNKWFLAYDRIIRNYEKRNNKGDYREYSEFLESIENYFNELSIYFKHESSKKKKMIYEMTALLIVLVDLDRFYKMIVTECERIRTNNPILTSDLHDLKMSPSPTSVFTYESLLKDMKYGYLIEEREGEDSYQLKLYQYNAMGRKMLFTLSNIKEHIGQPGPAVIGLSGTSFLIDSLRYNFIKKPDLLLESINEDGSIRKEGKITAHYIPTVSTSMKNYKKSVTEMPYVTVSGSGSKTKQRMERYYNILQHLDGLNNENINYLEAATFGKKPGIIVTGNYNEAEGVHHWLQSRGYHSLGLVREEREGDFTITRGEVEGIAKNKKHKEAQFFVVSLESIARGYNILNDFQDSHFGSVFFLNRPYPQPLSLENSLKKTHALYDYVLEDLINDVDLTISEKLYEAYRRNSINFDNAYHLGFWNDLTEQEKLWISADALVSIKQMIGRTQRNQNSTDVYFCDGAFCPRDNKDFIGTSKGDSMFDYWLQSLEKSINQHPFGKSLFGEFYRALKEMVNEYKEYEGR